MRNLTRFAAGLLILGAVGLTGCNAPAPGALAPAHVGTWHVAGQKAPTVLSLTEETFMFTVGDGTAVLEPIFAPEAGTEPAPSVLTKLTVTGSLTPTDDSVFTLTVPEDGVSAEFVEGFEYGEATIEVLTVLFHGLSEEPMMVAIDAAGTSMTIRGSFFLLLTQDPRAVLTACKSQPCQVDYAMRWWNVLNAEQMVTALYGATASGAQASAAQKPYEALDRHTRAKVNAAAVTIYGAGGYSSVGQWWETLDCRKMRIAAGDGNTPDPTSPYCAHYPGSGAAKILSAAAKAHVDKVGMALLGRSDPGVYPPAN